MDSIKKLRNLLHEIDSGANFKEYDAKIKKHYSYEFEKQLNAFNYDEDYFIIKTEYSEDYKEYLTKLKMLKERCNRLLLNSYSLENFKLPARMYKGKKLVLDNLANVEYVLEYLENFTEKGNIYHNLNKRMDFEILKHGIVNKIDSKKIPVKHKYKKMNREDVISDILKSYDMYYVDSSCFNTVFAKSEKVVTKKRIHKKIELGFLKTFFMGFGPSLILAAISIYAFVNYKLELSPLGGGGGNSESPSDGSENALQSFLANFSLEPLITFILDIAIFVIVLIVACCLARLVLSNLPICRGFKGYIANLVAMGVNLAAFWYIQGFNLQALAFGAIATIGGMFFTFFGGPSCKGMDEQSKRNYKFSLMGRLLITFVVADYYFMLYDSLSFVMRIVILCLIIYGAALGNGQRKIDNSPWYGGE